MLVSDKYEFIVAMPTKTGTNSLRAVVEKWRRSGGSGHVLDLLTGEKRTRHRVAPPTGKEHYRRVILWRPEESRLPSMYEYLRRKDWEWAYAFIQHEEGVRGREAAWVEFLRMIAATREADGYFNGGLRGPHGSRPYMWTDTMAECEAYLRGSDLDGSILPWDLDDVDRIRTDHFTEDWHALLSSVGVEGEDDALWDVPVTQRNATPVGGRLFNAAGGYWDVPGAYAVLSQIMAAAG